MLTQTEKTPAEKKAKKGHSGEKEVFNINDVLDIKCAPSGKASSANSSENKNKKNEGDVVKRPRTKSKLSAKKKKRLLTCFICFTVIAALGLTALILYNEGFSLKRQTITIWVPKYDYPKMNAVYELFSTESEDTQTSIVALYQQEHPGVDVIVEYVPADYYISKLLAISSDADSVMPDIFTLSVPSQESLEGKEVDSSLCFEYYVSIAKRSLTVDDSIREALSDKDSDYGFIAGYSRYFQSKKYFPTSIRIPVMYLNSSFPSNEEDSSQLDSTDAAEESFKRLSCKDFITYFGETPNAVGCFLPDYIQKCASICFAGGFPKHITALDSMLPINTEYADINEAFNSIKNAKSGRIPSNKNFNADSICGLFGYNTDIQFIRAMTDNNYNVYALPGNGNAYSGEFSGIWCIGDNNSNAKARAAELFLPYLLTDEAQNTLSVNLFQTMPINEKTLSDYLLVNSEFTFINDFSGSIQLQGEAYVKRLVSGR